jgi:hypothetical protein
MALSRQQTVACKATEQLQTAGYVGSAVDPCLFMKGEGKTCVYIIMHVDDALLVGEAAAVQSAKSDISNMIDILDLGSSTYFLGKASFRLNKGFGYCYLSNGTW